MNRVLQPPETVALFLVAICCALLSCVGQNPLKISNFSASYSGYVVVATVASDTGGPSTVSLFSPDGTFLKTLLDLYSNSEYVSGLGYANGKIFVMTEGTYEQIESIDLNSPSRSVIFSSPSFTSNPFRHIAVGVDQSIYVASDGNNTLEKIKPDATGAYSRIGTPFASTTTGSCVLSSPWGVASIPTTDQVAVANVGGGISIFNNDGSCALHVAGAPFNSNNPLAIAYHALSNKLIVAMSANGAIYSVNLDGTSASLIYQDTGIISVPRSVSVDGNGYIYISNTGRDTIEKLWYSGSGSASRYLGAPLIGPSRLTANASQILVIP